MKYLEHTLKICCLSEIHVWLSMSYFIWESYLPFVSYPPSPGIKRLSWACSSLDDGRDRGPSESSCASTCQDSAYMTYTDIFGQNK